MSLGLGLWLLLWLLWLLLWLALRLVLRLVLWLLLWRALWLVLECPRPSLESVLARALGGAWQVPFHSSPLLVAVSRHTEVQPTQDGKDSDGTVLQLDFLNSPLHRSNGLCRLTLTLCMQQAVCRA